MVYVVKTADAKTGDKDLYLRDGFEMIWTTQGRARRFKTQREAKAYVMETGWPRRDHGLLFVRLRPKTVRAAKVSA